MTEISLYLPEIVCLVMALVLFFAPVCSWRYSTAWGLAVVAGIAAVGACLWSWPLQGEPFFAGIYRVDFFSQLIKTALALGYLFVVAISKDPQTLRPATWHEFPLFSAAVDDRNDDDGQRHRAVDPLHRHGEVRLPALHRRRPAPQPASSALRVPPST